MTPSSATVAVVQAEIQPDVSRALEVTVEGVRQAREAGASLVAFPETWIPGYPAWLDHCRDVALWDHEPVKRLYRDMADRAVSVPGPISRRLAEIAQEAEVTLVVGVTERVDGGPGQGTLFNSLLTYGSRGELLNHHRKLVPTFSERMVWGPGDGAGLRSVETQGGRVGGLICWEHWMPLARQALHEAGEDIHIAAWPWAHELLQVASRHYAFEGRCFVLVCGGLMRADDLPAGLERRADTTPHPSPFVLRGGSAVIGPDGHYLVAPVLDEPRVLVATLDLGRRREEQMTLDVTGHYARGDVFDFAVRSFTRPNVGR
jgi:predicted amidohydrolase